MLEIWSKSDASEDSGRIVVYVSAFTAGYGEERSDAAHVWRGKGETVRRVESMFLPFLRVRRGKISSEL